MGSLYLAASERRASSRAILDVYQKWLLIRERLCLSSTNVSALAGREHSVAFAIGCPSAVQRRRRGMGRTVAVAVPRDARPQLWFMMAAAQRWCRPGLRLSWHARQPVTNPHYADLLRGAHTVQALRRSSDYRAS